MNLPTFLANTIVLWYKQLGFCGALRFRLLVLAYKLFPCIGSRYVEWQFVLNYLFPLRGQFANVLDVGSTSSLFIYELYKRGYMISGLDQRPYQETLPYEISYLELDATNMHPIRSDNFDFITCISTIEHIGTGEYGDKLYDKGDRKAIKEIHRILKPDGKLLITTHTKVFVRDNHSKGYTYREFLLLLDEYFDVIDYAERQGQILACCVKKEKI